MSKVQNSEKWLPNLIKRRRTRTPNLYTAEVPIKLVTELIDQARYAPNHHRTEPARFYLLDRKRIQEIAKQFAEVLRGDGSNLAQKIKADKKEKDWSAAHGLLVVTSMSEMNSPLIQKNPEVIQENYAATCCIIQNLLLLFENSRISAKWSTGPVWKHPKFCTTIGIKNPSNETVVALIFYGYSKQEPELRKLTPLGSDLVNHLQNN